MHATKLVIALAVAAPLIGSGEEPTVATLTEISGNVLVARGSEMASAMRPIRVVPGMRVLPTLNSSATIVFEDGCRVRVSAGERYVVPDESPCHPTATVESARQPMEARR